MLIDQALQLERLYRIIHALNKQLDSKSREVQETAAPLQEKITDLEKQVADLQKELETLKKKSAKDVRQLQTITTHLDSLKVPKGPLITRIRRLRKTPLK